MASTTATRTTNVADPRGTSSEVVVMATTTYDVPGTGGVKGSRAPGEPEALLVKLCINGLGFETRRALVASLRVRRTLLNLPG
jgi:hypothetical protein